MTDLRDAPADATPPSHVWVYGNDHSPWVQSVLLGLHEKGIAHTLVIAPPLSVFRRSGVLMPAARVGDGPWQLDSGRILALLGFSEVEAEERRALQAVFGSGALRRADDAWAFWQRFSLVRDGHPSKPRRLWHQFWRPFSMLYFFTLIRIASRSVPRPSDEQIEKEFSFWQQRIVPGADFVGGDAPDTVDLQLFGLVQMCASIPGRSIAVLRQDPKLERLRAWAETMQQRLGGYQHLYTGPHLDPALPELGPAPFAERFSYWSGAALMWIAFPITLPLVFYFVRRVRKKGLLRT